MRVLGWLVGFVSYTRESDQICCDNPDVFCRFRWKFFIAVSSFMLRVLHISPWYAPSDEFGGVPVAVTNMCQSLVCQGIEVHVFTTISITEHQLLKLPLDQEIILNGVRVYYFLRKESKLNLPGNSKPMNQRLLEKIPNFDLVHIHAARHWHGKVASSICSQFKIPFIVSPHSFMASWMINGFGSTLLKMLYSKFIDRLIFSKSAAVHYCSEHEREASKDLVGNIPSFVITSGVEIPDIDKDKKLRQQWRKKLNLSDSHRVLLFAGRIHPVKNLHIIIKAIAQLQNTSIKLFCVGLICDRSYFIELNKMIQELNLTKNVIFILPVRNKQLHTWYLSADAFVLPSIGEGASLSLSEAMSYGLPVIISDGVSNAENIHRAKCGEIVPQNVESFVKVFHDFINARAIFEQYAINARLYAKQNFDQSRISIQICHAYHDVMSGDRHKELNWIES